MNSLAHVLAQAQKNATLSPALAQLLQDIAAECATLSKLVRQGALAGILGEAGSGNVQGEAQKKLDVIANDRLIAALTPHPHVAGLASEELEEAIFTEQLGEFLVLFDPLDGSSNIDVNVSVGTIISILNNPNFGKQNNNPLKTEDFLQKGSSQQAALYALYGPQTTLVLSFGHGTLAFTLNAEDEFILTHDALTIPNSTREFAINMSNQRHWEMPVKTYIAELLAGKTGARGADFNMRWIASMVAEVHRILTRGGVFLYPKDARDPSKPGKLRLMYEANPMSFLVENAGGKSFDGHTRMLDIEPNSLHQRVAVMLGSSEEVEQLERLHRP